MHWAWARVFFSVGMAFTLCLKVSDVAVLRWGWLGHIWERWRQWLYEHRRPPHHDNALVLPGGANTPRMLQQEMFNGTKCSLTGWHPWKRMGAACFRSLGGSLQALTIWARWRTDKQHATRRTQARPGAPAETHGKYGTFHQRLRMAVDASPRVMACGHICVACRM